MLYVAWDMKEATFDPEIHCQKEGSVVLGLQITHREGHFPEAQMILHGSKALGEKVFIAWKGKNGISLLFSGFVLSTSGHSVRLTVYHEGSKRALEAAKAELKHMPFYDPLFIEKACQNDLDEILEGHQVLPHWSRQDGSLSFSHILEGRTCLDLGQRFYPDSLKVKHRKQPLGSVQATITAEWVQRYGGVVDLSSALHAAMGSDVLGTLTPEGLTRTWWKPFQGLGGSGYEVVQSGLEPFFPEPHDRSHPRASRAFHVGDKEHHYPCFWFRPQLHLGFSYQQKRVEQVSLALCSGVPSMENKFRWRLQDVLEGEEIGSYKNHSALGDHAASSYFLTDRGQQSVQHALARCQAHLSMGRRIVHVSFEAGLEDLLDMDCDTSIRIENPRIPGGVCEGKVIAYELVLTGKRWYGRVTLACAVGDAIEPALKPYGDQKPREGLLDPRALRAEDLIEDITVTSDGSTQRTLIEGKAFRDISEVEALLKAHPTRVQIKLKSLAASQALAHTIRVVVA